MSQNLQVFKAKANWQRIYSKQIKAKEALARNVMSLESQNLKTSEGNGASCSLIKYEAIRQLVLNVLCHPEFDFFTYYLLSRKTLICKAQ